MTNPVQTKLEEFFSQYPSLSLKKGELIIWPEENPKGIYFVRNGYVKMYSIFADGRELTLNIFRPNTFFSSMWTIADLPNSYYFQTITKADLFRANEDKFLAFIKNSPEVSFDLTRRVLAGVDGLLTNILHLLSGQASQRVIAVLILCAKRFGEKTEDGKILIKLPLTHQEIANMAGLTRETASVEMSKLAKKKLISSRHRLVLLENLDKLEEESILEKDVQPLPYSL